MGWETEECLMKDLTQLRNDLKRRCKEVHSSQHGEESPLDIDDFPQSIIVAQQKYVAALQKDIAEHPPQLKTDTLKNVKEFNLLLKQLIQEREQQVAAEKAVLDEAEASVKRFQDLIRMVQEALAESEKYDHMGEERITEGHVAAAREKFTHLRQAMIKTVQAHCGNDSNDILRVFRALMEVKEKDGYVSINGENIKIIHFLLENNIVTTNPYNPLEVKMYF